MAQARPTQRLEPTSPLPSKLGPGLAAHPPPRYVSIKMKMPSRYIALVFSLDANRINAMQKCPATNQLEVWSKNGVIQIDMCDVAQDEASKKSAARFQKASNYVYPITLDSHRQSNEYRKIREILFPNKSTLRRNEENDVLIILHAKQNNCILVTNDGGSRRQPKGILGNKKLLLNEIGVKVMRDTEAVELVEQKIKERDMRARRIAERIGKRFPEWVGKDSHSK